MYYYPYEEVKENNGDIIRYTVVENGEKKLRDVAEVPQGYVKTKEIISTKIYEEPDEYVIGLGGTEGAVYRTTKNIKYLGKEVTSKHKHKHKHHKKKHYKKIVYTDNLVNATPIYAIDGERKYCKCLGEYRETRNFGDVREFRDSRDYRDLQNYRDFRDYQDYRDYCDFRDFRNSREFRDSREFRSSGRSRDYYDDYGERRSSANKSLRYNQSYPLINGGLGIDRYNYRFYVSGTGYVQDEFGRKSGPEEPVYKYSITFCRGEKDNVRYFSTPSRYSHHSYDGFYVPRNSVYGKILHGTVCFDRREYYSDDENLKRRHLLIKDRDSSEERYKKILNSRIEHNEIYQNEPKIRTCQKRYNYIYDRNNDVYLLKDTNEDDVIERYYVKEIVHRPKHRIRRVYLANDQIRESLDGLTYPGDKERRGNSESVSFQRYKREFYDYQPVSNGKIIKKTETALSKDGQYLISSTTAQKTYDKPPQGKQIKEEVISQIKVEENEEKGENEGGDNEGAEKEEEEELIMEYPEERKTVKRSAGDNYKYYERKEIKKPKKNLKSLTRHKRKGYERNILVEEVIDDGRYGIRKEIIRKKKSRSVKPNNSRKKKFDYDYSYQTKSPGYIIETDGNRRDFDDYRGYKLDERTGFSQMKTEDYITRDFSEEKRFRSSSDYSRNPPKGLLRIQSESLLVPAEYEKKES